MASRRLVVEIVGDSRQLDRTFQRSSREAKKFERTMTTALGGRSGLMSVGRGSVYGAAAIAGVAGFAKLAQAASDLHEEITKSKVVFGSSGADILAWSKTTSESLKISQVEALRAAGAFGQMFSTIGLGSGEAADMSKRLVALAADLASFNNEDPTDMLDRLRSGLAGEAEPLRRFSILLSEARVKQEAYRSGIARAGAVLTEQQKVQARYNVILKDSSLAQGDVARSAGTLATKQRELTAKLAETRVELGTKLLPVMIFFTEEMIEATEEANTFADTMGDVARKLGDVGREFGKLRNIGGIFGGLRGAGGRSGFGGRSTPRRAVRPAGVIRGEDPSDKYGPWGADALPKRPPRGATVEQRNAWWDAMIGRRINRVQDISSLQGQISELRKIGRLIEQRRAATKDITRRLRLEDELLEVQRQIRTNKKLIALRSEALAEERRQLARERRERERQAREDAAERAREAAERARAKRVKDAFAMLGLTAEGEKPVPRMANLRRQLESLSRRVAGTAAGTRNRVMLNAIRKALALDSLPEEVRAKIRDLFQAIREELGQGANALQTTWKKVSAQKFMASLGLSLSPAEQRRLRAGISTLGAGGSPPPGRSTAFAGGGVTVNGDLVLNGVQNVRQLEAEIAKRNRSRPKTRRGAS